jgi:hypothetical protein
MRKPDFKDLVTLSLQVMDFLLKLIAFILAQKVLYPEGRFASNVCSSGTMEKNLHWSGEKCT